MRFQQYTDVKAFYRNTCDILMRHETQNVLPLGNLMIGIAGQDREGWRDPANWFMATVSDDTGVRLTALMTPPHNLTLYATDNRFGDAALACLIGGLRSAGVAPPGVTTEKTLAERFVSLYTVASGLQSRVLVNQRIYELVQVNPAIPSVGSLRLARESDMAFLPYWFAGFQSDCFGKDSNIAAIAADARYHAGTRKLYLLEDGGTPVSMAKISREMQTAGCIGYVYTPPYFRGRGYASACVAAVSRRILDAGYRKCTLYTDLANPVSNSIYQKIGYAPICDSLQVAFE